MSTSPKIQTHLAATLIFASVASSIVQADTVKWRTNVDAAKIESTQTGKLVLLHFWSTSCGPCRALDSKVFSQPQIGTLLDEQFIPVKISADQSPALASAYAIDRVPTDVLLSPQGNVVAKLSCPLTPHEYGSQLVSAAQHFQQRTTGQQTAMQPAMQSAYAGLQVGQYNNMPANSAPANNPSMSQTPAATQQTAAGYTPNLNQSTVPGIQTAGQTPNISPYNYQNPHMAQPAPTVPTQAPTAQLVASTPTTPQMPPASASTQTAANTTAANTMAAGAATVAATSTATPTLPPGSPPLGFDGHCPVSLKQLRKWVKGDRNFGAIHRGRTYLFAGETQRKQFLANPDAYGPVFSGMDAVKVLDENQAVEGSRRFGFEYRGSFYLFASKESMDRFASQPDHYATGVRQAMAKVDGTTQNVIRR